MIRRLVGDEWAQLLHSFERSAFRLEQQLTYAVDVETGTVDRFTAGDPQDPLEIPHLAEWFSDVRRWTEAGRQIGRVRIVESPPTPYQLWEKWLGSWNIQAGETLRYLPRVEAHDIGLLPAAGSDDWWLLDDQRLVVMSFDDNGFLFETNLVEIPERISHACAMRDLAIKHSELAVPHGASRF